MSRSGFRIHLLQQPQERSPLRVTLLPRNETALPCAVQALFEIVWVRPEGDGWAVGAELFSDRELWALAFSAPPL